MVWLAIGILVILIIFLYADSVEHKKNIKYLGGRIEHLEITLGPTMAVAEEKREIRIHELEREDARRFDKWLGHLSLDQLQKFNKEVEKRGLKRISEEQAKQIIKELKI